MLEDLADHADGSRIDTDVAIIGAGAAGITLARRLAADGRDVCLLESGGLDFERDTQDLAAGDSVGHRYYDLVDSRLRFFGGTTNIWGGRCSVYGPLDIEQRSWVPHSGWPLAHADLAPYYERAGRDFGLGDGMGAAGAWHDEAGAAFRFDPEIISTARWRFDDAHERFSPRRADDLMQHPRVRIVTHANVTGLAASADANALDHLLVRRLDGAGISVRAAHYVLAAGGIENARILLASREVETDGLGNGNDQVGRYFMEHPHARAGILEARAGFALWAAFQRRTLGDGSRVAPVLLPSALLQQRESILNVALTFKLQRDPAAGLSLRKRLYRDLKHQLAPTTTSRGAWHRYRDLRKLIQRHVRKPLARVNFGRGITRVHVMVRGEQAPNPASRVTLAQETDALGVPRAVLDWRLSELDKRSVAVLTDALGRECERLGIGRLSASGWLQESGVEWPYDETVGNHPIAGYHHIGTTRMSASPRDGVVDADCRVHGYANLYVAGSSVFPTASWANPTLTIVALAHRLADHLGTRNAA